MFSFVFMYFAILLYACVSLNVFINFMSKAIFMFKKIFSEHNFMNQWTTEWTILSHEIFNFSPYFLTLLIFLLHAFFDTDGFFLLLISLP